MRTISSKKTLNVAFATLVAAVSIAACGTQDSDVSAAATTSDKPAVKVKPGTYGSDPVLDALWDDCEAGDNNACEDLYYDSPVDSEYEAFGRDNMDPAEVPLPPAEADDTLVLNGTEMTMDEAIGEMVLILEYAEVTDQMCYEDATFGREQAFNNFWTGWQTTNDDLTRSQTKTLYEGAITEIC